MKPSSNDTLRDSDRELAGPGSETLDEYRRRVGGEPFAPSAYDDGDVFELAFEARYGNSL